MIIRGSGRIGLPQQIKEGGSPETGSIHQPQRWHASRCSSGPRADGWLRQRHEDVRGAAITSVTLQPQLIKINGCTAPKTGRDKMDNAASEGNLGKFLPKSCSRCCV